jgi:hypothetical protein
VTCGDRIAGYAAAVVQASAGQLAGDAAVIRRNVR